MFDFVSFCQQNVGLVFIGIVLLSGTAAWILPTLFGRGQHHRGNSRAFKKHHPHGAWY